MIEALVHGAEAGAWLVGFCFVLFVGFTAMAAFAKWARSFTGDGRQN